MHIVPFVTSLVFTKQDAFHILLPCKSRNDLVIRVPEMMTFGLNGHVSFAQKEGIPPPKKTKMKKNLVCCWRQSVSRENGILRHGSVSCCVMAPALAKQSDSVSAVAAGEFRTWP